MAALDQSWTVGRREAVAIALTGTADPTGWAVSARLSQLPEGPPLLTDLTVTKGGSAGAYTLTVALTATHTDRSPGRYRLEVWRTDAGSERRLAAGTLAVDATIPAAA